MTFAFRYLLYCPHCKETYNSGAEIMLATEREQAGEMVLQKHRKCPICGHSLEELGEEKPEVSVIFGDAAR